MRAAALILLALVALSILPAMPAASQEPAEYAVTLRLGSAPYEFQGAGSYRGAGYSSLGGSAVAWLVVSNPAYGEGDLYLGLYEGYGILAWRVASKYVKQVSLPAGGEGVAAVAYSLYGGSTRLDVYLAVAGVDGYKTCQIAATDDYEEYPAVGAAGGYLAVFFYNSSDRDYYLTIVDPGNCSIVDSWRVWDGSIYYRYASQVSSGSGGGLAAFAARDEGNGYDIIVVVTNGSSYVAVNATGLAGDEVLGASIGYSQASGMFAVPFTLNGTLYVAWVAPNGTVEVDSLNVTVDQPAWAASYGDGVLIAALSGSEILVFESNGPGNYSSEGLPAPGADLLSVASSGTTAALVFHNASGVYLYKLSGEGVAGPYKAGAGALLGAAASKGSVLAGYTLDVGITTARAFSITSGVPEGRSVLYLLPEESKSLMSKGNPLGLLGLIARANTSIHAALAFFENMTLAQALVEAYKRGVDVQVVTDDDSLEYGAVQYMISEGIPVYTDAQWENETGYSHTMHEKFIVIDGRIVVIGTANPTTTGLGYNYENILVFENATLLALALEAEFQDLAQGNYGTWDERDVIASQALLDPEAGLLVATVFQGPEHRHDWEIEALVRGATTSIDMAEYIFTTSWTIRYLRQAILDAVDRGVTVTAVFDSLMNLDTPGRFAYELVQAGVEPAFNHDARKMHAKTMVFDGQVLQTGSYNPTGSATRYNDEVTVIVDNSVLAGKASGWIRGHYAEWHKTAWKVDYHPLISSVGIVGPQYIAVYNPTGEMLNLSQYLVGDAETLFPSDDEGLYRFPEGAVLEPGGQVIVAYNASEFEAYYGFKPDYEIVDSDPAVPQVTLYLPGRFGGNFTLDPAGDEAVLAMISPYDPEFLYMVDMVAYGNSTALPVEKPATPEAPYKVLARLVPYDSLDYTESFKPTISVPVSLYSQAGTGTLEVSAGKASVVYKSNTNSIVMVALLGYKVGASNFTAVVDVYSNTTGNATLIVKAPFPVKPSTLHAYALLPGSGWVEVPAILQGHRPIIVNLTGVPLNGTPVNVTASAAVVGGALDATGSVSTTPLLAVAAIVIVLAVLTLKRERR